MCVYASFAESVGLFCVRRAVLCPWGCFVSVDVFAGMLRCIKVFVVCHINYVTCHIIIIICCAVSRSLSCQQCDM